MMKILRKLIYILIDRMINNDLNIDKEIIFAIVIGQITIYGILLTFYQFVASYQGNEKAATTYLGINLSEYFVKKNISVFDKLVSKRLFAILFILEILYKPIMVMYRDVFPMQVISIMNFLWFSFVVFYFAIFAILFFQCTKSILEIKLCSDAKRNGSLIYDINQEFLKKTVKQHISKRNVELLNEDFQYIGDAIKYDDNPDLQVRYNQLIYNIFYIYEKRKIKEISRIEKKGIISKNQVPWAYNANCEIYLLGDIIDGKYFSLDENNMKIVFTFYMKLLELNLKRAKLAGYQKVSYDKYMRFSRNIEEKVFDASEWKNVALKIYRHSNDEMKRYVVNIMQEKSKQSQKFYQFYCEECIFTLIKSEIEAIFDGEREQKDFVKIFGRIIKEEANNICADIIRDKLISYNRFDATEIISQLNKKNCTYLFTYIIMCYSLYRFRFEWEYINIGVLKILWERHSNMKDDAEETI